MLRRSPLRPKSLKRQQREKAQRARSHEPTVARELHPVARAGVYAGSTTGPAPKGERAKPGKSAPTAAERRWLDAIVAYGCIACRMDGLGVVPPAVHHILRGGVRMGHLFTLPLCDPGHHQNGAQFGKVSRHPWKARFEQRYGSEEYLLAWLRAEIGAIA